MKLKSGSPLQSGCLSAKASVVWVERVVGTALDVGRNCVGGKGGSWSSRAIEDGSVVVAVVAVGQIVVVVVVGACTGGSSNKGCHRDVERVSGGVARKLVRTRILNLVLILVKIALGKFINISIN